ncbi:hypothetical protein [Paenibacillus sp. 1P07SE]|uniref:hypothetical protein n=1 Tax=Paenibacillus sp. 1P07SE TaxID=3132209 RepID=UPI0039A6C947
MRYNNGIYAKGKAAAQVRADPGCRGSARDAGCGLGGQSAGTLPQHRGLPAVRRYASDEIADLARRHQEQEEQQYAD